MEKEYSGFTESTLIKGCIKGDRKFQELLYHKYARTMYAICLSYTKDRATAQDILQDSFVKVFDKIKTFNQQGSLEGWIKRIISNTAIDHFRKKSTLSDYVQYDQVFNESDTGGNALDHINAQEVLEQVTKLPDGARVIFNLYAIEGYSHKEISKKLNISIGTSKSQFSRARNILQNLLKSVAY
jgi:RNA polymerase sigma factor (sigma-70 family)